MGPTHKPLWKVGVISSEEDKEMNISFHNPCFSQKVCLVSVLVCVIYVYLPFKSGPFESKQTDELKSIELNELRCIASTYIIHV